MADPRNKQMLMSDIFFHLRMIDPGDKNMLISYLSFQQNFQTAMYFMNISPVPLKNDHWSYL